MSSILNTPPESTGAIKRKYEDLPSPTKTQTSRGKDMVLYKSNYELNTAIKNIPDIMPMKKIKEDSKKHKSKHKHSSSKSKNSSSSNKTKDKSKRKTANETRIDATEAMDRGVTTCTYNSSNDLLDGNKS